MTYVTFIGADGGIGYVVYEGENTSPGGLVSGDPLTAHDAFMARLHPSTAVEDFQGYPTSGPGSQLQEVGISRNGVTATINSDYGSPLGYFVVRTASGLGRFNTTPGYTIGTGRFLENCASATGFPVTITFSAPIAAFGFYLTDLGDFSGQISMVLTKSTGGTVSFDIGHTIPAPDGSLYFWGFVDDIDTYTQVQITCSSDEDLFGIDDWVFAPVSYLV